ncbi:MAG: 30S ribosomal protein S17 [Vampirovibrionales bacterium]|jgi:small subunit ribosomal protein S17|nr:30S ribosomal protein S17 [Vampirovibrionales bacterium]
MATRELQGVVSSTKSDKTAVVLVVSRKSHAKYGKVVQTSKKFHAHDELNELNVGDEVVIVESRPLSKLKRWSLKQVVRKAEVL